MNIDSRYSVG